jgi:rhodanese-related sulfurtransferase
MTTGTTIIDVRTPDEFALGHLDGAINVDWEGATFATDVSALDPVGTYIVYCRSGNRAGHAKTAMEGMGFTDLTNAGGLDAAAVVTGLAILH